MAIKKFTDGPGLAHAFSKVKALVATKANKDLSNVDTTALSNLGAMRCYTKLSELGLSGAVTMEQVCTALPDGSMIVLGNTVGDTSGNYISDTPNNLGTVEVVRYSISRIYAQFMKADDTSVHVYFGKYHSSHGWSGWLGYSAKMALTPPFIELTPEEGADNGGYIDFHFAGSSEDYTTRIIEEAAGVLSVFGNLKLAQELKMLDSADTTKGARMYASEGAGLSYMNDPADTNSARTGLKLNMPEADLANIVRIYHAPESGEATWYNLYGEHNKPSSEDVGALAKKPPFIEFAPDTTATNGGYIDFHYAGATDDYTSRIVESASGVITLEAPSGAKAGSYCQSPTTSLLRNSKLVSADTTPTNNGEIFWTYG